MRILFLGSGPFGIPALRKLHSLRTDLRVATVPDAHHGRKRALRPSPIKAEAQMLGLEVFECQRLRGRAGREILEQSAAQLIITADIRLILGSRFLEGPPHGCFNLHGSLLPRWRGAAPVVRALLAGDEQLGVTLYRMVTALDAGPMVGSRSWTAPTDVTAEQAEAHLALLAAELLEQHLEALERGDAPQTDQPDEGITLAPKVEKSEGWARWDGPASFVDRQVRALKPWPRTRSTVLRHSAGGQRDELILDQVRQIDGIPGAIPGTVLEVSQHQIVVACGQGAIAIERLQRIGKNSMTVQQLQLGMPFQAGDRFEGEDSR